MSDLFAETILREVPISRLNAILQPPVIDPTVAEFDPTVASGFFCGGGCGGAGGFICGADCLPLPDAVDVIDRDGTAGVTAEILREARSNVPQFRNRVLAELKVQTELLQQIE